MGLNIAQVNLALDLQHSSPTQSQKPLSVNQLVEALTKVWLSSPENFRSFKSPALLPICVINLNRIVLVLENQNEGN